MKQVQRVASAYLNGDRDEMMQMTRTNGQMQSQKSRRVAALQAQMVQIYEELLALKGEEDDGDLI